MKESFNPKLGFVWIIGIFTLISGCGGSSIDRAKLASSMEKVPVPSREARPVKQAQNIGKQGFHGYELSPSSLPMLVTQSSRPREYVIGIEDVIKVSVFNNENLDREQAVRPDGKIALPLIGDIHANGVTPKALRDEITNKMAKYIRDPQVDVIVKEYRSYKIYILGEVRKPGLLRLNTYVNLLEAISLSDGFTLDADLQQALLVREKSILPVNFYELFVKGDMSQNLPLLSGDAIFIPNVSERRVFVLGEVQKPGVLHLRRDISLIEAISQAGGFTRAGKQTDVYLVRGNPGNPTLVKTINVDAIIKQGQAALDLPLQAGDIIFVPKTKLASLQQVLEVTRNLVAGLVFSIPLRATEVNRTD